MTGALRETLLAPGATFASGRLDRHPVLGHPAAVLLLLGTVTVVWSFVPASLSEGVLLAAENYVTIAVGDATLSVSRSLAAIVGLAVLAPFVFCLYVALPIFVLATLGSAVVRAARGDLSTLPTTLTQGTGRARELAAAFRRTAALIAVGLLPQLVATTVAGLVTLVLVLTDPGIDATLTMRAPGQLLLAVPSVPAATALTHAVGAACTLWSGYVWVGAVESALDASRRTAAAAVVPVTLALVYASNVSGHLGL